MALVTGAASGIGLAAAERLAQMGMTVMATDLAGSEVHAQAERLAATGLTVNSCVLDVTSAAGVEETVAQILDRFGRLDVLINSAGIVRTGSLPSLDLGEWNKVLEVNLTGCFLCMQAALPVMTSRGYGRIVSVASMTGKHGHGVLGGTHYAASKAGLLGLTKAVAVTAGPSGITCNAVCPGVIDTPMMAAVAPDLLARVRALTPVRRLGAAGDVAALIGFLASAAAGFVTGEDVNVNGGYYIG